MKSSYPPSYFDSENIIANGTYVKIYSLGLGRGLDINWKKTINSFSNNGTSTTTIRLTCQDNSTVDLVFPTTWNTTGTGEVGEQVTLPLIVKAAEVISNASAPGAS
jgi:hypothetical protein